MKPNVLCVSPNAEIFKLRHIVQLSTLRQTWRKAVKLEITNEMGKLKLAIGTQLQKAPLIKRYLQQTFSSLLSKTAGEEPALVKIQPSWT